MPVETLGLYTLRRKGADTEYSARDRLEAYPTLLPGVSSDDSSAP
jgi:hypothetical protein